MAELTLRSAKGSPLTNAEIDGNFVALNEELAGLAEGGVTPTTIALPFAIETPANGDYTLMLKAPFAGVISETNTKCASGSCTMTFKVNLAPLGGAANAVTATEQSQPHAANNAFVAGDDIVVTVSANSAASRVVGSVVIAANLG